MIIESTVEEGRDDEHPAANCFQRDGADITLIDPVGFASYFGERVRTECLRRFRAGSQYQVGDTFKISLTINTYPIPR